MKIVVFGATGHVGSQLVELALAGGHEVTAFARSAGDVRAKHPQLKVIQGDVRAAADVEGALAGQDAVVSAIGSRVREKTTLREDAAKVLVAAMQKVGVRRLVYLSAAGVGDSLKQAQRSSFVYGRILIPFMLKDVFADAARAEDSVRAGGLEWVVVRPVGYTNKPARGSYRAFGAEEKVPSVWITRGDVARSLLDEATKAAHAGRSITICE